MKIELFKIGGLSIHGYGFMIGIGFILALFIAEYRAKKNNIPDEPVIDIAIIAGVIGFLGGKILYVITEFSQFLKDPWSVLGSSGFVVYGGIIAAILVVILYCKLKKLSFLEYFDLMMPEIAIAQGFGRIGCFLAGCCYGRETDSAIGVIFPTESMAPAGIKLIPTQLFSSAGDFAIAIILIVLTKKKKFTGEIGTLYLALYAVGRFIVECFRNDKRGAVGFLSTSQFISIFMLIAAIIMFVVFSKKKKVVTD